MKDFGEGSGVTGVVIAGNSQAPVKVISAPPANVRIVHKTGAIKWIVKFVFITLLLGGSGGRIGVSKFC